MVLLKSRKLNRQATQLNLKSADNCLAMLGYLLHIRVESIIARLVSDTAAAQDNLSVKWCTKVQSVFF